VRTLLLVSLIILAGCGASAGANRPHQSLSLAYSPARAHVPACTHAGSPIRLPAHFPAQFPVPAGTDLVRAAPLLHGVRGIGVYGYVPSASFVGTVHFFPREVKKAGFSVLALEIDTPNDSEGTYQGHGYQGRWALNSIPGCKAMRIGISAVRIGK